MILISAVGARLRRLIIGANLPLQRLVERQLVLQAQMVVQANRSRTRLAGLHDAEFCAYSQWGEDGIIDWLVERLPGIPRTFVEFGVENYRESNTRLLLQLRNWRGLVIDGSAEHVANIQAQDVSWRHHLTAVNAFIDRDNIDTLIADAGLSGPIGLLSIDIDGNDYWVWQAITVVDPAIVVLEYNAVLGDRYALTVPYAPDFQRTRAHHSNLYFGASLPALIALGHSKGYTFVGTTSTGCNAFFVRDDLAPAVVGALEGGWGFPSQVREARNADGSLAYVSGTARADVIAHLPLVVVDGEDETTLADLDDIYSPEWKKNQGRRFDVGTHGMSRD